jgi:putative ABC transport system ATP-binding protein
MNFLETNSLTFAYKTGPNFTFKNLSLGLNQALLIKGKSGTGKSTLLSLLGGLQNPSGGSILINGTDITQLRGRALDNFRALNIAFLFQESWFVQSLNLMENFKLVQHFTQKENEDLIFSLSEKVGIQSLLLKKPAQLSTGEKQRAALVRSLAVSPKLLLADEPTSNLDDENCEQTLSILLDYIKNNKASLVVVSHDNRLNSQFDNHYFI